MFIVYVNLPGWEDVVYDFKVWSCIAVRCGRVGARVVKVNKTKEITESRRRFIINYNPLLQPFQIQLQTNPINNISGDRDKLVKNKYIV